MGLAAVACCAGGLTRAAPSELRATCPSSEGLQFVCGTQGSEDLVRIPGTSWLVASGLKLAGPAHLYLIDTREQRAFIGFPLPGSVLPSDGTWRASCPAPPDLSRLSTDGLGILPGRNGVHRLFAANHGDRRAIEFFEVDARAARPNIRWVGCAVLPDGTLPNAVAPLAGGGLLVTSFYDPGDARAWEHMARGEPTGRILEWQPGRGFRELPGSAMSGANGLETSADERVIYASAWSARRLVILPREGGRSETVQLDFLPDNIHRLEDGSLLVGGQRTEVERIARCGAGECPQPWTIVRIEPRSHTVTPLLAREGSPEVNYACGGLVVGKELYLTARGSRSVALVPWSALPSLR